MRWKTPYIAMNRPISCFWMIGLILCTFLIPPRVCATNMTSNAHTAIAVVNYGGVVNIHSSDTQMAASIGQTAYGTQFGNHNSTFIGLWGIYMLPPGPPAVSASDGEYPDQIEITWEFAALSSPPDGGFEVYRDGTLLATVPTTQDGYQDFNVIPGQIYEYAVAGVNEFGTGTKGYDLGFVNPNGVITGRVMTPNSVPVVDVEVMLDPDRGKSLLFDGSDTVKLDPFRLSGSEFSDSEFTIEYWFKGSVLQSAFYAHNGGYYIHSGINGKHALGFDGHVDDGLLIGAAATDGNWHHIAMTWKQSDLFISYLDGEVVQQRAASGWYTFRDDLANAYFGSNQNASQFMNGRLDDVRLWTIARTQEQIQKNMSRTVDADEPGLFAYWKLNEGFSNRAFDLARDDDPLTPEADGEVIGAVWSDDTAPVRTSGITDESGNYNIQGIDYGSSTTFTVTPHKEVLIGRSLRFNGADNYIALADTSIGSTNNRLYLPEAFTLEAWVKLPALGAPMSIIRNGLGLSDTRYSLEINGAGQVVSRWEDNGTKSIWTNMSLTANQWYHLAVVREDETTMRIYVDGQEKATTGSPMTAGAEGGRFRLGAVSNMACNGWIDNVKIWNLARSEDEIQTDMVNLRFDADSEGLVAWWSFNEGSGAQVSNATAFPLSGTIHNATWTEDTPYDDRLIHEFNPEYRLVTLSVSNTAADDVTFVDTSLIPISGYVRYEGTDCFADSVEIRVDGESHVPPIFTDSDGYFVVDLEPGRGYTLSPLFRNHTFSPTQYTVTNLVTPLANVVFYDTVKRNLSVQMLGGHCRFPLMPPDGFPWQVTFRSSPSCYDTTFTVNAVSFQLANQPPLNFTIEVEHPNPNIDIDGQQVSLVDSSRTIEFVHFEPITVVMTGLPDTLECDNGAGELTGPFGDPLPLLPVLQQYALNSVQVQIFEDYSIFNAGTCDIDSGTVTFYNEIASADTTLPFSQGRLRDENFNIGRYQFTVGLPNLAAGGDHPFQWSIYAVAQELIPAAAGGYLVNGRTGMSDINWVYVEGNRPRQEFFVTVQGQEQPMFILRDPPGDDSYSYLVENNTHSTIKSFGYWDGTEYIDIDFGSISPTVDMSLSQGGGGGLTGPSWEAGFSFNMLEVIANFIQGVHIRQEIKNTTEVEISLNWTESFSTTDEETGFLDGENIGDVFVGLGFNFGLDKTDKLIFNKTTCTVELTEAIAISDMWVRSVYFFSENHIRNSLIPELEVLRDFYEPTNTDSFNVYQTRVENWQNTLALNDSLVAQAISSAAFPVPLEIEGPTSINNIAFDGAAGEFQFEKEQYRRTTIIREITIEVDETSTAELGLLNYGLGGSRTWGWVETDGASTRDHFDDDEFDFRDLDFGDDNDFIVMEGDTSTTTMSAFSATRGFLLGDDDVGDNFWVEVWDDGVYGFVFNLRGGASSCPWEQGTAKRQDVSLSVIPVGDPNQIMPDETAVFNITMTNLSWTEEAFYYDLVMLHETNPDGAVIAINGNIVEDHMTFYVPGDLYGGNNTVEAMMTILRGPTEYDFSGLTLQFHSICENELAILTGQAMPTISSQAQFEVHYLQPCSEVTITEPDNNWWLTPTDNDTMLIVLTDYDKGDPLLNNIQLLYRPVNFPGGRQVTEPGPVVIDHLLPAVVNDTDKARQPILSIRPSAKNDPWGDNRQLDEADSIKKWPHQVIPEITLEPIHTKPEGPVVVEPVPVKDNNSGGSIRADGWIEIDQLTGAVLAAQPQDYYVYVWDVSLLSDGNYEIRAEANCDGNAINGHSQIMAGIIERHAPEVMGTPQPADGVLHNGDDISIAFNERIDCGPIHPLVHGELINTVTGDPIDYDFTCSDYEMVVNLNIENRFIENQTLRMTVHGVEDLFGNEMEEEVWEFFVNRNPVAWSGGNVEEVKYIDETLVLTRQLTNSGAVSKPFELQGLPSWMTATPMDGEVEPNVPLTITFTINANTIGGDFEHTVFAHTNMGDEPLHFDLSVLCRQPAWAVNPADYLFSMRITAKLDITPAPDLLNVMVGAMCGPEVRGSGYFEYIPALDDTLLFMTVYSDSSGGETISFRAYETYHCQELGQSITPVNFVSDQFLGSPSNPYLIELASQMVPAYDFTAGWNWFSLNVTATDMDINSVLSGLPATTNDMIKSQTSHSFYVGGIGWVGVVRTLNENAMYMIRMANPVTAEVFGYPLDLTTAAIPLNTGWNWISYHPQDPLGIDDALSSLSNLVDSDVIMSQTQFAQFVPGIGWIGNLTMLEPKNGYKIKVANPGTLTYPDPLLLTSPILIDNDHETTADKLGMDHQPLLAEEWLVDPAAYEHAMSLVATIQTGADDVTPSVQLVGAFVGDECRGTGEPIDVEALDQQLVFMMIFSNDSAETVHFKLLTDEVYHLTETVRFEADGTCGSPLAPFGLTLPALRIDHPAALDTPTTFSLCQNFPNPFNPQTTIRFDLPTEGWVELSVYNAVGQKVKTLIDRHTSSGYHSVIWHADNEGGENVKSGVYFYKLKVTSSNANLFEQTRKLLLLK